ncbi:MAG: glycosyltransferase family 66 [Lasallia pustulata]|uniref:dolichyl-diphosphooligosaccharide--protein glycotransferase n=1 Tax=Lasallia pustulata TaxID=136370 RepID=A0A5M8Q095_9LECA|nr:MAG: glycosyltransferase family 66 [Lasallia pustulata]
MASPLIEPFLRGDTSRNTRGLLRLIILCTIAAAAVSSRLFSVLRFESIIHESILGSISGQRSIWYRMDSISTTVWLDTGKSRLLHRKVIWLTRLYPLGTWHPLGRVTGGTLYPGLMVTSGAIYHLLRLLSMPVDIRNICALLAPAFSGLTAFEAYLLTSEMSTSPSAGLLAAVFMGIAPGYISRSVAGSYDNEAIAIFLLVFTFFLWIKSVKNGSAMWGGGSHCSVLWLHGFCLGWICLHHEPTTATYLRPNRTLASMQIPFVGFLPVKSSEHMSALGVFGLLSLILLVFLVSVGTLVLLTVSGVVAPWTGRFYSLWDTGYAKIHIPIIASVSEHQPTAWPAFFFDLNLLIWLFPAGVYLCFQTLKDEQVFIVIYAVLASYFAGVMVRLMLTLIPVVCVAAALALSRVLDTYLVAESPPQDSHANGDASKEGVKWIVITFGVNGQAVHVNRAT